MKHLKIWTLIFAVFLLNSNPAAARETRKPNIIFLMADDLIFDGIGAYGRADMKTPNLDRIADKGFRFMRFYNTTAICMASRAQYMTGLYEFSTGCNFDRDNLAHELWEQSYPEILQQNGYITGFAGKFGFRVDEPHGKGSVETVKRSFDWWCGWLGQGKYDMAGNREAEEYIKLYGTRSEHTTHALGQMGKAFIQQYADDEKPFCLSISFKAPHTPYDTDPRYDSTYASWEFDKPDNYGEVETLPPHVKAGRPYSKGKSWLKNYQQSMRNYHQMVYGMDAAVGMIISELEKQQIDQHTVIIFTSDNGHLNGVKGCSGKLHPYEEGSLAPLLYFDPRARIQGNSVVTALSGNIDIAPTILELAGAEIPEKMEGKSLLPLLSGEATSIHPSMLLINAWGARAAQSVAVVTEQWKYIHWFYGAGDYRQEEELYHMGSDRLELSNEVHNPNFHGDLEKMRLLYDRWMDHWESHYRPGSDYGIYSQLAGRGVDYGTVSDSLLHIMGVGVTESDRKLAGKKQKQPNILFIMADDHASNAVGAYGSHLKDVVQTPNIDRLANEGALLTNVVCSNSLCTPSRASILTGKYSHKSGVYTLREELNTADIPTLPKLFSRHGYQTAVVGKWHIHGDNLHGFDHYAVTHSQGAYINPSYETREGKIRREGHSTDIITDLSIEWLQQREQEAPFLLFTHYKAAHSPWHYAERHSELFAADTVPEPPTLFDSYENRAPGGVENNQARIHKEGSKMSLSYWFRTNKKGKKGAWPTGQLHLEGRSDEEKARATYQKYVKDYMRCVKGIDEGVGRIIAYLERTGELDNTVIIYTSDQGMYVGEHNFFDKRLGLEEAMKMPFLVRYPKEIERGIVVDKLVNNVDYPSTLLDFANIEIPEEMQGISFREVLRGKEPGNLRRASFYAFYSNGSPKHYGIRTKDSKLLKYVDKDGEVTGSDLFNLSEDPHELVSLYDNPAHSILQQKMEQLLTEELLNVDIEPGQLPGKLTKQ